MTPLKTHSHIGAQLAGYRLDSLLGRGGMGIVYLAEDLRLRRNVALKLVAPEMAADARFRERFLREAELAASLDHSHLVPVHAAGETDGQLWIAMRYVQGTDLGTLLEQEGPLEPARALELCSQVGEALDAAHAHGLVHRDVKPANVLVTEEGGKEHCYLSDFGLARGATEPAREGETPHLSGTVDYTAPEQIAREPADHRADVYSLACVFYECLAGEPPFKRPRATATLFAHASEPPPSLHERRPELPEAIDKVLAKALDKDPDERYGSCCELIEDAGEALGLTRPWLSRRRLLLVGTGAALALAAAAAIPAILLGSRSDTRALPPPILPVTEESLVRIDPATSRAVAAIPLGPQPVGVAVGEGSVWVIDSDEKTLARIDPEQSRVAETVDQSRVEEPPSGIAAGEGAVWTIFPSSLLRYDPAADSLTAPADWDLATETELGAWSIWNPTGIAVGADALWFADYTSVVRVDPSTGAIVAEVLRLSEADSGSIKVAVGEGVIWAASLKGLVARIDSATNRVRETSQVDYAVYGIAAGEGGVWALASDDDLVLRLDPTTLQVTGTVRVGRSPSAIAAAAGAVWVTSERDGTVTRIDPDTFNVTSIHVGGAPNDVAVGAGAVWVTVDVR
jgi:streptogramin lyase